MRTTFPKAEPKVIRYRKMGNYNSVNFSRDLEEKLKGEPFTYDAFEKTFLDTLEIHAPQKTKTVRANNKPYLNKDMRKAIMHRSSLQNKMYNFNTPVCLHTDEGVEINPSGHSARQATT